MQNAFVVTGEMTDGRTVVLDEALPGAPRRVRLIVEPLPVPAPQVNTYQVVMAAIRERQKARGHRPPTPQEVDAYLQAERDSWGES